MEAPQTEDVWTACAKYEWDYNKLYDIFHKAGVSLHSMRVASPFMSEAKSSLGMYRVINPDIWARLCARVQGANFTATYGKQLDYKSIKLPITAHLQINLTSAPERLRMRP